MGQIMLNKSFIGSWGQENSENIPHEIINRFRSDNGNLYIYSPPYGGFDTGCHQSVDYLLLTGSWNRNMTEILFVVKGLSLLHHGGKKASPEDRAALEELICRENIRYGGKFLHEIKMSSNEEPSVFYATFRARELIQPRKKLFFSWSPDAELHNEERDIFSLPSDYKYQRQYGFLPDCDDVVARRIISDTALWETVDLQPVRMQALPATPQDNFIKLICKEYDETIFTNLFHAFFNASPALFTLFAQEVLEIPTAEAFTLRKEVTTTDKKGRLDLLAEGPETVIAIENKLRSGLNGIDKHHHLSQLTPYINFVEQTVLKGRRGYYFLFEPNYNEIDVAQFDTRRGGEWKKCPYSKIHQFMIAHKDLLLASPLAPYAEDFIRALALHTLKMKDLVEQRFLEAILG